MKLTKEQRDNRDQMSARAAIEMALCDGKTVGIAVDNAKKVKLMLARVKEIANSMNLEFEVRHGKVHKDVIIGSGCVRIVAMLKTQEAK